MTSAPNNTPKHIEIHEHITILHNFLMSLLNEICVKKCSRRNLIFQIVSFLIVTDRYWASLLNAELTENKSENFLSTSPTSLYVTDNLRN